MPRRNRLVVENIPLHIIQRGNNRNKCFFDDFDYQVYLMLLKASSVIANCHVHAYVLMSNHVHILVTPEGKESPAKMMKMVGEQYVQYVNRRYDRVGTLWQGRYRSCLIGDDTYFLVCQRYIELNPVRAGMVSHPSQYRWSSHACNAYGNADLLIRAHSIYEGLGRNDVARRSAYRKLFDECLSEQEVEGIRASTNNNFSFGSSEFQCRLEESLGHPVRPGIGGRPSKSKTESR